jgi:tRNA-2-methylthio-N6-dimethylallyladenosine synthase
MEYYIWTEGCQMNVADSQRVASTLENLGYHETKKPESADVIVLNTCVVRQSAEDKALGRLSSLKPLKKKNPNLVINLMGCLVGVRQSDALKKRLPYVDVFSGPSDPTPLVQHLLEKEGKTLQDAANLQINDMLDEYLSLPVEEQGKLVSAFIPVVLGCSHACTYCIIPSRRGREISRPPEVILREARDLVAQGVKEITLLGQIVDRYGLDNPEYPKLDQLIHQIHEIEGLERIRFLTSHPNYMTDAMLHAVRDLPKVMPHFELPNQAGDDEVLKAMRRGYTGQEYRDLISKIREMIPGVSIATDIIVGFPGETDEQFQNTYDILSDLKLDVAHLARYSPREGTPSARNLPDDVPDEVKWNRFRTLEDLQKGIAEEIHQKYLNQVTEVLFEAKKKSRWRGRTPTNKLVIVETEQDLARQLLPVKIEWTGPWSMIGSLAEPEQHD